MAKQTLKITDLIEELDELRETNDELRETNDLLKQAVCDLGARLDFCN